MTFELRIFDFWFLFKKAIQKLRSADLETVSIVLTYFVMFAKRLNKNVAQKKII